MFFPVDIFRVCNGIDIEKTIYDSNHQNEYH